MNEYKIKREPSLDEIKRFVSSPATRSFIELGSSPIHMAGIIHSPISSEVADSCVRLGLLS